MGIYKHEKSPYWWADVNVPGHPRLRFSTRTTDRIEAQKIHDRERAKLWNTPTQVERRTLLSTFVLEWCRKEGRTSSDIQSIRKFMAHYGDRCMTVVAQDRAGIDQALRGFIHTPGTYTRYRARIRAILQLAKDAGVITDVPKLLRWEGTVKKAPNYIKDEGSLMELLRHLAQHQRPMVLFAVYTGLRQANVLGLRWERVDMQRKLLWVDASEAKARKAIQIPLNTGAMFVLEQQLGQHPVYVFTYRGRPIKEIKTAFMRACVEAGLGTLTYKPNPTNKSGRSQHYEGLRWHDLRHTFASWHAMSGTPPQVLKVLGGWSSMRMLENYAHLSPSFVAEFADNITKSRCEMK